MEGCKYTYVIALAPLLRPFDLFNAVMTRHRGVESASVIRKGSGKPTPGERDFERDGPIPPTPRGVPPTKESTPIRLNRLRPIRAGMACRY